VTARRVMKQIGRIAFRHGHLDHQTASYWKQQVPILALLLCVSIFLYANFQKGVDLNNYLTATSSSAKLFFAPAVKLSKPMISIPTYLPKYAGSNDVIASCQLDLQEEQKIKIDEWISKDIPILVDVIQFDDQFYRAIFQVSHISEYNAGRLENAPSWKCNNNQDATILRRNKKVRTMIVQCKAANTTLHTLNLKTKGSGGEHNYQSYNTTPYQRCDELRYMKEKNLLPKISGTKGRKPATQQPRLGVCTSIRGENNRAIVDQWIEYHRMIGVDHFFVYVNEEWNDLSLLPQRPYVTYIPFDYCLCNHLEVIKEHNRSDLNHGVYWKQYPFFQELINTHCLQHAKRLNFDWITTHDVDEYIHVMPPNSSLPKFLGKLLDESSTFNNAEISSLIMKSRPYGKNPSSPNDTQHPLLIDYVWIKNSTIGTDRQKLVVNAKLVNYLDVHGTKGEHKKVDIKLDPSSQLYIHHYKNPEKGVFKGGNPEDLIKDESLAMYRNELMSRLLVKPE
jgi:hypothetical protein